MIKKNKAIHLINNQQIAFPRNIYNEQLESKLRKNFRSFYKQD